MPGRTYLVAVVVLAAVPLWSQAGSSGAQPAGEEAAVWSRIDSSGSQLAGGEAMAVPAPFSDNGYSLAFASETPRTNYVRGGLNLETAYDDHILPSSEQTVSDVRYSVWPSISLTQSRSRVAWDLTYSPGFAFYQHHSSINEVDHYLTLAVEYRLSPHVTLNIADSFQKTASFLNLPDQSPITSGSGGGASLDDSIVPPATARLSNFSDARISYQFGPNAMVGAKAALSGLWYPNGATLGLFDSTTEAGSGFYAHRFSGRHYIGATYEFQRLLTHPGHAETQTQSMLAFYTLYLPSSLSASVFAGPEHSDTHGGPTSPLSQWSPAAGGSLAWHGERVSLTAGYARKISDGGGLSGAVHSNRADASVRCQLARNLISGLGASYSTNSVLDSLLLRGSGGHTWSGTASLQHPLRENLSLQIGYTHLHQSYGSVSAISNSPDRNNVWISLSYLFERPLGR